MEIDNTRKILAVIGILLIVGSLYMNLLGILEANTENNYIVVLSYIVSANFINGLAVICLILLTINSTKLKLEYKILIVICLVVGLISEYYLFSTELYSKNYINYIILIINLLIRVYYLIYYFNESWAMFPGYQFTYVKNLEKLESLPKQIESMLDASEGVDVSEVTQSDTDAFKEKWRKIVNQAKEKVGRDNFDDPNAQRGRSLVIDPAIKSGDFSLEKLKEASKYLKDKSGKEITDLVFGGRKRR